MQTEDERKKQRIEELLEKYDLYVKWHRFCLIYVFHVEDNKGNYLWGGDRVTAQAFRDSLLMYLEEYNGGE